MGKSSNLNGWRLKVFLFLNDCLKKFFLNIYMILFGLLLNVMLIDLIMRWLCGSWM